MGDLISVTGIDSSYERYTKGSNERHGSWKQHD
jgi:hypothetical protein